MPIENPSLVGDSAVWSVLSPCLIHVEATGPWICHPAHFSHAFSSFTGFSIYFGYGLWHSVEASLAADPARTPDDNLDRCK